MACSHVVFAIGSGSDIFNESIAQIAPWKQVIDRGEPNSLAILPMATLGRVENILLTEDAYRQKLQLD